MIKFSYIKKMPNGDYRVLSSNRNFGCFSTKQEAIQRLKQIESYKYKKRKNASSDIIDLSKIDSFSYSGILRELRSSLNDKIVNDFITVYHSIFEKFNLLKIKNIPEKSLEFTIKYLTKKYNIKINKEIQKKSLQEISIPRFAEIEEGIYRGGAPSVSDVELLQSKFGIKRIISLDYNSAAEINDICKKLKIQHIVIPISASNFKAIKHLPKLDWSSLFYDGGPSFIHCLHGKDRTGLAVASFRCQQGWSCEKAIKEADKFEFCIGLPKTIRAYYTMLLNELCDNEINVPDQNTVNDLPIPDYVADYKYNNNYEIVNPNFAPEILEVELPLGNRPINTTNILNAPVTNIKNIPQVGIYDNPSSINSIGPVPIGSGYVGFASEKNMLKKANNIQMSYDLTEYEINSAQQGLRSFDYLNKSVDQFNNHLDKMFIPFKDNTNIPIEQIWKARTTFRKYRDESENNLNKIKKMAIKCVSIMNLFMSDNQVKKIMEAFDMAIEDVSQQFERFKRLFQNIQDKDFIKNSVEAIKAIKKEIAQLKQIIEERIQKYIEKDILAKSWRDNINNVDIQIEEKIPFDQKLIEKQKNTNKLPI